MTLRPSKDLAALLSSVLADPVAWLETPNHQFGGRKPAELIGTDEEFKLIDILRAAEYGLR